MNKHVVAALLACALAALMPAPAHAGSATVNYSPAGATPFRTTTDGSSNNLTNVTIWDQAAGANGLTVTSNGAARTEGVGTAGSATGGVVTVQGVAAMTPLLAAQSGTWTVQPGNTANTTPWLFTGSGSAGSAATGVLTVQGIASMTPVQVSQATAANLNSNVSQATAGNLNATVVQGNAGSNGQAWWARIGDATNGPVAVKAASTAAVATDPALVVAISPNNTLAVSTNTITNPTSTLSLTSSTTAYSAGDLIANNATAGSITVPSFAINAAAGPAGIPRLRLTTNDATSTAWGGVVIAVDLWTAAPTFTNGDNGAYLPATGVASHWASYSCTMSAEYGDGAYSECAPTTGSMPTIKLASGTSIFWTLRAVTASGVTGASKIFTLTAEVYN